MLHRRARRGNPLPALPRHIGAKLPLDSDRHPV
ncbi:hypothetical protein DFO80_10576 [Rhodobacter sp. 140A]|nr:hypothetical protein DFO80_10576 [Rhodobacter sp. 140A]